MLLKIGKLSHNNLLFFWLFTALIAFPKALGETGKVLSETSIIINGNLELNQLLLEIVTASVYWVFIVLVIAISLSEVEFRENGICIEFSLKKWKDISSYAWKPDKPNMLTLRFRSRLPLPSGILTIDIDIPAKHKDAVNHILSERLLDQQL